MGLFLATVEETEKMYLSLKYCYFARRGNRESNIGRVRDIGEIQPFI